MSSEPYNLSDIALHQKQSDDSNAILPDVESLRQQIGLTDEQIFRLDALRRELNEPILELYQEMNARQQVLETLLVDGTSSPTEIRELHNKVEFLRQTIIRLNFEYRLAVREVLKPEQRKPYDDHINQVSIDLLQENFESDQENSAD